jgi:NAD(P)-dependent dehydrogenase (short-subunit alcohol dehydrogenase family)
MKKVIITGAAGGIGEALCKVFSNDGYEVIGIDLKPIHHQAVWRKIRFDIANLHDFHNDQTMLFYKELKGYLQGELQALINNAAHQVVKKVTDVTPQDWDYTLQSNLLAPFWLTQQLLPELVKAHGTVTNIASIHALLTKKEFSVYATSKGALVSLTRAMAIELAPEVRVNAVIPAATDTPMLRAGFNGNMEKMRKLGNFHPLNRIADPTEVAQVALFLASQNASFITGSAISVDGGIGACLHDPID